MIPQQQAKLDEIVLKHSKPFVSSPSPEKTLLGDAMRQACEQWAKEENKQLRICLLNREESLKQEGHRWVKAMTERDEARVENQQLHEQHEGEMVFNASLILENQQLRAKVEQLREGLEAVKEGCEHCDWSCPRCGNINDMKESDIYLFTTRALSNLPQSNMVSREDTEKLAYELEILANGRIYLPTARGIITAYRQKYPREEKK